jgi:hypothetical protein
MHPQLNTGDVWTQQRPQILECLASQAPPLGETYAGIVHLLFGLTIPGRARFIAHGVREIGNNLASFMTSTQEGRVQYEQLTGQILNDWRAHGLPIGDQPPPVPLSDVIVEDVVFVPRPIVVKIGTLLAEHEAGSVRAHQKAQALYTTLNAEQPSVATLRPVVDRWRKLCLWFLKRTHHNGKMDDEVSMPVRARGSSSTLFGRNGKISCPWAGRRHRSRPIPAYGTFG